MAELVDAKDLKSFVGNHVPVRVRLRACIDERTKAYESFCAFFIKIGKGEFAMQFKQYNDVHEFYKDTYDIMMRHEAQNLIPLGNLIIGHAGTDKTGWRDPANWLMATVTDNDTVLISAIMTPPHNLTLYATDNKINKAVIDCLIEGLADCPIPGVLAEKSLAKYFAQAYTTDKGMTYETTMDQRIYELTKVNPDIPQIGALRLLEERDMPFFPYWLEDFYTAQRITNANMPIPQVDEKYYHYYISQKKFYILEDNGVPVSMAGFTREMQTVCGVAYVYTPPYYRGKGYATSCVAQLSQIALERGFAKCVLYTDLANLTSNSIYQKIGYNPICDSLMLKFNSKLAIKIVLYYSKYRDDMLFCYLTAKDELGRHAPKGFEVPKLKDDLLDVEESYIRHGDVFYLAVDESDGVVGMIGTKMMSQTELLLKRLFIKPDMKGKGIGTILLAAVEKYAAEKGITAIHTQFANWYPNAADFYSAKGFVMAEPQEYLRRMVKRL